MICLAFVLWKLLELRLPVRFIVATELDSFLRQYARLLSALKSEATATKYITKRTTLKSVPSYQNKYIIDLLPGIINFV